MKTSERILSLLSFYGEDDDLAIEVAQLEEGLAEYLDMCLTYTVDFGALQAENAKLKDALQDIANMANINTVYTCDKALRYAKTLLTAEEQEDE